VGTSAVFEHDADHCTRNAAARLAKGSSTTRVAARQSQIARKSVPNKSARDNIPSNKPGNEKGPHRCGPCYVWLPDLGSNQGPAD